VSRLSLWLQACVAAAPPHPPHPPARTRALNRTPPRAAPPRPTYPPPQNDLIATLVRLYSSTLMSDASRAWNAFRAEAVEAAVHGKLLPVVEREAARRLEGEARDVVLAEASDA
jgi:hypothetical protein